MGKKLYSEMSKDEKITAIKAVWEPGMTAAEIAGLIGCTRNAVVGVFHRNKKGILPAYLTTPVKERKRRARIQRGREVESNPPRSSDRRKSQRADVTVANSRRSIQRTRKASNKVRSDSPKDPTIRFADEKPIEGFRHLQLMDLQRNECRYPDGNNPFTFCGLPTAPGSSYCSCHNDIALTEPRNVKPYERFKTQPALMRRAF